MGFRLLLWEDHFSLKSFFLSLMHFPPLYFEYFIKIFKEKVTKKILANFSTNLKTRRINKNKFRLLKIFHDGKFRGKKSFSNKTKCWHIFLKKLYFVLIYTKLIFDDKIMLMEIFLKNFQLWDWGKFLLIIYYEIFIKFVLEILLLNPRKKSFYLDWFSGSICKL